MITDLENSLNRILEEKLNKIKPENIKSGVTMFDITGTYEGESGGSTEVTGIKQFATEEEMQADETAKEGDLALVYRSEIQPLTADSVVSGLSFKSTVVLDTAITSSGSAYLMDEKQSYETQCQLRYSSTYFYIRDYYTYEYIVRYERTDGITYTKVSGQDSYEFNQPMHFSGTWNDIYGEFIQCGGMQFEGLYEYGTVLHSTHVQCSPLSSLTFDVNGTTVSNITYSGETVGGPVDIATIKQIHKNYLHILW